jgi:uncharacterized membrane protein
MENTNRLFRRACGLLVTVGLFVSPQVVGAASDFTYVSIDAVSVGAAYGVNNAGQIVGIVGVGDAGSHGFLLDGDTLTYVDVPGARTGSTRVRGINDGGDMVGIFNDPSPPFFPRGFVYRGAFELLWFEQAVEVFGINNDGYLVGRSCCERGGNPEGFIISPDGSRQFFNVPDSPWDWASSINAAGQIVGTYAVPSSSPTSWSDLLYLHGVYNPSGETDGSRGEATSDITFAGYLFAGCDFIQISVPGSSRTDANGINDAGQIVGSYDDQAGTHGFFLDTDGTFTALDFPGATYTAAYGINNAGEIIGTYVSGGQPYAFAAYPADATTRVTLVRRWTVPSGRPLQTPGN